MFKEAITEEYGDDNRVGSKSYRYGYIHLVSMESIENSLVLAALTFVDISGAIIGAVISIVLFILLAMRVKIFLIKYHSIN